MSLSQCCPSLSCAQVTGVLLPHLAGTVTEGCWRDAGRVGMRVRPAGDQAACPRCGQLSGQRHGGYPRRLRDVPAGGQDVVICLAARRFRCGNPACPAVTFTEQVQGLTARFSRRTPLLGKALSAAAAALGGRGGARLAAALGIVPPSRQTMIRLVMGLPEEERAAAPQVLGVDDFALRRGHVYGTVLIDGRTGQVADLLPDREAATVEAWLKAHPGAEVICRDRAGAYAEGARAGAPGAAQAADRWHLLHNLCQKAYETAAAHRASCLGSGPAEQDVPGAGQLPGPGGRPLRLAGRTRQRHAEIHGLLAAGHSQAAVTRITGLSAPTVAKYARAASPAGLTPAARASALDPFKPYLTQRWNDGARDARALHAELTARGYAGSDQPVRRYLRSFRALHPGTPARAPAAIPSARQITTWLMTRPDNLTADDTAALAAVTAACPHLAELSGHIRSFAGMITGRTGRQDLDSWLDAAQASTLDPLRSLARGIRKDHAAVLNALTLPWSNGRTEGTVNKIKMIKRQMYGRAGFPLLRKRVLLASQPK